MLKIVNQKLKILTWNDHFVNGHRNNHDYAHHGVNCG